MSDLEAERLQRALNGDDSAFEEIVDAYQRPVYNLCYRMLGDPIEAEDAAQETFWRAYQGLKRYDPKRSFVTWLLSIAAHYCIDQQRKRRFPVLSMDLLPEEDAPDNVTPSPDKVVSELEEKSQMRRLLKQLGPQDRAAVVLRYWHEFSEEEIAQTLSLTVSAVKSRLHRARKELAQNWREVQAKNALSERRKNESPAL